MCAMAAVASSIAEEVEKMVDKHAMKSLADEVERINRSAAEYGEEQQQRREGEPKAIAQRHSSAPNYNLYFFRLR